MGWRVEASRRTVIGAGAAIGAAGILGGITSAVSARPRPRGILAENLRDGSDDWRPEGNGVRATRDDWPNYIQAYASATSVAAGESLAFHVSVGDGAEYVVSIYRLGYYGGAGARLMTRSSKVRGAAQRAPKLLTGTGTVHCGWEPSWRMEVPDSWLSGLYVACFTTPDGRRACTPFVVRDDGRVSDFLVVLPFTTYQAYNMFPGDGVIGRNLYKGYVQPGDPSLTAVSPDGKIYPGVPVSGRSFLMHYPARSRAVTFGRPYAGGGLPSLFDFDLNFIKWAEERGLDVSYASSLDLHDGTVRPSRHRAVLFSGHDEYWSAAMRDRAERAVHNGTHLAFFAANNIYFQVRIQRDAQGFPLMTCYKSDPDPVTNGIGRTTRWRDLSPEGSKAEQGLLGTQYIGMCTKAYPLVVRHPRHWLWAGTGVDKGDRLDGLVTGEADGIVRGMARPDEEQILLSESPFRGHHGGEKRYTYFHRTSLYQAKSGAWVFNAGTFGWVNALSDVSSKPDKRIQRATTNLLRRFDDRRH